MRERQVSFPLTLQQVAVLVHGTLHGNPDQRVDSLNSLQFAEQHELTFLAALKFVALAQQSNAPMLVSDGLQEYVTVPYIIVPDAYTAFAELAGMLHTKTYLTTGYIHPSSVIHPSARVEKSASIGPGCVVGENCTIGKEVQLIANVVLYNDCSIESNTLIHANVVCYAYTQIGERCVIHSGAVLGSDGFGFIEQHDKSYKKIPQIGNVRIGNDVEIGANATIDRAALGTTILNDGVKLDNLVHIAHGVRIGEHTAIAAQTGVSGSTTLGKRNRIAGQVGIVGHVNIADDVIVFAQSGVAKEITDSGTYFGSPARDARTTMRIEAALRQLPDLLYSVRELQKDIAELKKNLT